MFLIKIIWQIVMVIGAIDTFTTIRTFQEKYYPSRAQSIIMIRRWLWWVNVPLQLLGENWGNHLSRVVLKCALAFSSIYERFFIIWRVRIDAFCVQKALSSPFYAWKKLIINRIIGHIQFLFRTIRKNYSLDTCRLKKRSEF